MRFLAGLVLLGLVYVPLAHAQTVFRPAVDSKGYVTINGSQVLGSGDLSFGLVTTWGRDVGPGIENQLEPQLQAALGLWRRLELGVGVPLYVAGGPGFADQGLGDLQLHSKLRLLDTSHYPVGLAVVATALLPTHSNDALALPTVVVDKEWGRLRAAANLGARLGASRAEMLWGGALSYAIVPQRVDVLGELYGAALGPANPTEALAGVKLYLAKNSYFELGGGIALNGDPRAGAATGGRIFVGFLYEPAVGDRDGDGIKDDVDQCPDDPEDFDGFEDQDGCPDPDNDRDGIPDVDDMCPNLPETRNGYQDDDGCPDSPPIRDTDEKCPNGPDCPDLELVRDRGTHFEIIQPIYFRTDSDEILPVSFPILDAMARLMIGNPQILELEVEGHADERGSDAYNMNLTERRAHACQRYLIARGVESNRLDARGYGETRPKCHSHTPECWSQNRRVDFVIRKRTDEGP
ncbi:MAG TPA: OmpA family protein [Polyangia bacterium]|nr:OmpA family protein [Polyangia bacterium]